MIYAIAARPAPNIFVTAEDHLFGIFEMMGEIGS
jgi:hypothetical protein